jgi:hypothetical protein
MLTISDFILARVSEEEALAHSALDHLGPEFSWEDQPAGEHFEHWNPWRVESACLVRRLLVKAHRNAGPAVTQRAGEPKLYAATCATCGRSTEQPAPWPCYTLRVLALDWANHPDYQPEWRPLPFAREQRSDPEAGGETDFQGVEHGHGSAIAGPGGARRARPKQPGSTSGAQFAARWQGRKHT